MTTLFERITRGRRPRPRRVLIYGTGGVGKSTWASCAPSPIFLPIEDGIGDIECAAFPLLTSWDQVCQALDDLYEQPHDFRTIVLDSVDWLERLIWDQVCRDQPKPVASIEDIGYAKGYTFALSYWRALLDGMEALRTKHGMTCILIGHSKIEKFESPDAPAYDRYSVKLHRHAAGVVCEWADEVLFARHKTLTTTTEEGFGVKRTRGISTGERVLCCTEKPSHVAKNRLDLPDEIPLLWSAYADHFITEESK